jgi:hypothetical protein
MEMDWIRGQSRDRLSQGENRIRISCDDWEFCQLRNDSVLVKVAFGIGGNHEDTVVSRGSGFLVVFGCSVDGQRDG